MLHFADAKPLKFSVPKKWLEKPLKAVVEFFVDDHYNKKNPEAPLVLDTIVARDTNNKLLSLEEIISTVAAGTEDLFLEVADAKTVEAAKAVQVAPPPAAAAAPAPAAAKSSETYTVTKEELEACFGLGAASRLMSHRRQRQMETEGAAKKAKITAPVEKVKETPMEELRKIMTAQATLMTGKGTTWNRPLVDKIFAHMEANAALKDFVDEHAAQARKKPSKELQVDAMQASLKALAALLKAGKIDSLETVSGLVTLFAVVEMVVKYRGADSLDMLVLLQRRWNQIGPQLYEGGGEGAEIAPMVYKEMDRVASMCLKKFFQRTITSDEQESEDKFVTVLARHMMKKAYNPKKMKSVALQMAEDALDDQDQFETTSQGKELKKMFVDAGWGAAEQALEDIVFFRCELNQGLAMYLNMNLVRLGRKVADQPQIVGQLVQVLPQQTGGDPEAIFCGMACVLAIAGMAIQDGKGAAVILMLSYVTELWAQLAKHLQELDGVQPFVRLLDDTWVNACERYAEQIKEVQGVAVPTELKKGEQPTPEQLTALYVKAAKEQVLDRDEFVKMMETLPQFEGVETKAAEKVKEARAL